ncbi:MAG: prolipoprotein diacylglyceryl transferase [Gammaproteobacteria bacterium]
MLIYPEIDPVLIQLGPLAVRWYGLMYLIGFVGAWWLGVVRARRPDSGWREEEIGDLLFYVAIGVIVGGRVGYMLFYNTELFLSEPWRLLFIWEGGMAFHGGLLGVLVAVWLFARRTQRAFFGVVDFVAPLVPIGLGAGRIGNFINGELWGAPGDVPWAMAVSCGEPGRWLLCEGKLGLSAGVPFTPPLHPSQLYQFFLEGLVLFVVLWWVSARPRPTMFVSGLFGLLYGVFRFLVEFVRMPDLQLGYLAWGWLTMGQLLSLPLIVAGLVLIAMSLRNRKGVTP